MPHRPHPLWRLPFAICLTTLLAAAQQQSAPRLELPAGKALQEALHATARAGATTFTAEWKWPDLRSRGTRPELENPPVEHQHGTFADDVLLMRCNDEAGRWQAWQLGRVCVVSHDGKPWQLAKRRATTEPDEARLGDPLLLLLALAEQELPVAQRAIAERNGRAIERFSIVLEEGTTERLAATGAMRDPNPSSQVARSMVKSGMIKASDAPTGHVDLCIELDVATRTVRRVHLRALVPQIDPSQLMQRARRARGNDADEAAPAEAAATKPLEFVDGLPVRDPKDLHEAWFVVEFGDAGKAERPQPDADALRALGR